ncbi:MAG: hypothetical protein ABIH39_07005 [Candidatus Margulisiibacteriota bacterium]
MRKFILFSLALLIITSTVMAASGSYSATSGLDFAMFKRYASPAYILNENGLLTIPIADTIGKGKIAVAASGINAGEIDGTGVYYSTGTIVFGTSDDVEIGISKKALVYTDDFSRTDIGGVTFHLKLRLVNLGDFIPKVSIGMVATSLTDENEITKFNTFIDAFAVASSEVTFWGTTFAIHGGAESGFIGDTRSELFFFAGSSISIIDFINVAGEYVGAKETGEEGIINVTAAIRVYKGLEISLSMLDINGPDKGTSSVQAAYTLELI